MNKKLVTAVEIIFLSTLLICFVFTDAVITGVESIADGVKEFVNPRVK